MFTINIKADLSAARKKLQHAQKVLIPSATRWAINESAKAAKTAEEAEMRNVFDRPTPYTMSAIRVRYARSGRYEALVWLKDESAKGIPATKFLLPQIKGGQRNGKRFEIALQRIGVMPAGKVAVPGPGAKIDAYGNISRGQIIQILSFFRASGQQGYTANMTNKGRAKLARGNAKKGVRGISYFVSNGGHLAPGIWSRTVFGFGSSVKPVMFFVDAPRYKKRFDFSRVAEQAVKRTFRVEFDKAIASLSKSRLGL